MLIPINCYNSHLCIVINRPMKIKAIQRDTIQNTINKSIWNPLKNKKLGNP